MLSIDQYLSDLQSFKSLPNSQELSEMSYRTPLENFLRRVVDNEQLEVQIFQEKRASNEDYWIRPDFACLSKRHFSTLGYIETKNLGYDISSYTESEQIKKYQKICDNVLLTNYTDFIWITSNSQQHATINRPSELETLIKSFLQSTPPKTKRIKDLSYQIAYYSRKFKDVLLDELSREFARPHASVLYGVYKEFENSLIKLDFSEFSDAFAQMTAFGFMIAKLNKPQLTITLENVRNAIPKPFGLIKELLRFVDDELLNLDEQNRLRFYVQQLIGLMNAMDVAIIEKQLFFRKNEKPDLFGVINTTYTDPFIYFYEDFLAQYDPSLRKARGVYYTPMPIVQLVVKLIDKVLIEDLNRVSGIGDESVTALDFACGTGTFLVEYAAQMLNKFDNTSMHSKVIKERLLPNLKGFEYLAGAYTTAILKFSQFLKKNYGYSLTSSDSIQIKLTNTLEDDPIQYNPLFPLFSQESEAANKIKRDDVLVVMGNPPYSSGSTNRSKHILELLSDYKKGLKEKKVNLDDDYIKFIRFAHHKMNHQKQGVVGVITNNSFLDGMGHRIMREKLLTDFDKIYIINLHGNAIKKEGDRNIFDIRVGVCITILIKLEERQAEKEVYYFSTKHNQLISRAQKTEFAEKTTRILENSKISDAILWQKIAPLAPHYFFVPKDFKQESDNDNFWSLKDIFEIGSIGIQTKRDHFTLADSHEKLINTINDLKNLSIDDVRLKYNLPADGRDWTLSRAKLGVLSFNSKNIISVLQRPFDIKYTYLTDKSKSFIAYPRYEVMKHFTTGENIGLVTVRNTRSNGVWQHAFITNKVINGTTAISTLDNGFTFPLYIYGQTITDFKQTYERIANFTKLFKEFINNQYNFEVLPEQVMGYIYGIMFTPDFRSQSNEMLKVDFAHIPFTKNYKRFSRVSNLGWELIQFHLMNKIPDITIGKWQGSNFKVIKIYWQNQKLYISNNQYLENVSEDVYQYEIGGYKVLQRYLKERDGKELTISELEQVEKIVKVLTFTIAQQQLLDIAYLDINE